MSSQSDIVEKVRRLLALSKSSNIHESAAAAAVAHKYIVKYRLQESDLIERQAQQSNQAQPVAMYDDPEPMYESAHVTPWKLQLASILAHHYGCAIWNDKQYGASRGGKNVSRFRLIGRYNDVKFAKYMFSWLVSEIKRHCDIECRGYGHASAASYCLGAVKGIENLLRETREQALTTAQQSGQSRAIARLDDRSREAQEYMYRKYHLVQPAAPRPRFDPNAFERGFDVGSYVAGHVTSTK